MNSSSIDFSLFPAKALADALEADLNRAADPATELGEEAARRAAIRAAAERLEARGRALADNVDVGEAMVIRLDRKRSFKGRIAAARFHRIAISGSTLRVIFAVTLVGTSGNEREYFVCSIPTRS